MMKLSLKIGVMMVVLVGLNACANMYTSVNGSNNGISGAVGTSFRW